MLFIHGSNIKMGYRNDVDLIIRVNDKTINEWFLELFIQPDKQYLYKRITDLFNSNYRIVDTPPNILHIQWEQIKWYGDEQEQMDILISLLGEEGIDSYIAKLGDDVFDITTNSSNEGYELGYVSRSFVPNYKE